MPDPGKINERTGERIIRILVVIGSIVVSGLMLLGMAGFLK